MRSVIDFRKGIKKSDMVIGVYYSILFRFTGFSNNTNSIMSDMTFYKEGNEWRFSGDSDSILCYDNEIIEGTIYKCSQEKINSFSL
jgi:hypothetical protein